MPSGVNQWSTPVRPAGIPALVPQVAQAPTQGTQAQWVSPTSSGSVFLGRIRWSSNGTPAGMTLTIAWTDPVAGSVSEIYYITAAGPGFLDIGDTYPAGAVVTVTLSAVSGVTGSVYVQAQLT